jgi:sugar transferase (PEP-CTERM system associated)
VVRLFNVYFPLRFLVLMAGEILVICASFLLATLIRLGDDSYLVLAYENGFYKILVVAALALLCLYYFDLYDLPRLPSHGEVYARIVSVVGVLSLVLAGLGYLFPSFMVGNGVFLVGLSILGLALCGWRFAYSWLVHRPYLRERVFVLGAGEQATRLVKALRDNADLGLDVVDWAGALENGSFTREALGMALLRLRDRREVDRVIVAIPDRRGLLPVEELLQLRLSNVRVEESAALLEQVSGKIEVDELYPSWLIFSNGFRQNAAFLLVRRLLSLLISLACSLLVLPLIPLIMLAVKCSSPGPLLYRQKRVGRNGMIFACYKFRTMRADAEADTGPTWAGDDDPRITPVGRWLRRLRLDEIPQLWNVLRGDMGFVGPRPERPEFVELLAREIPYYHLRHAIRPGITGWAQVRYKYGSSIEDAKEKLRYDLYYIKNVSFGLDFLILFQTIKTILLGRGAQ